MSTIEAGLGFFSERLLQSMALQKITSRQLAPRIGCSYEFVRRMTRGESLPSAKLLGKICSLFRWSRTEANELVRVDECRRKFGTVFWTSIGKNPRMEPVYILFPYFTDGEQNVIIAALRADLEVRTKRDQR
jgi:hypothetical protein